MDSIDRKPPGGGGPKKERKDILRPFFLLYLGCVGVLGWMGMGWILLLKKERTKGRKVVGGPGGVE